MEFTQTHDTPPPPQYQHSPILFDLFEVLPEQHLGPYVTTYNVHTTTTAYTYLLFSILVIGYFILPTYLCYNFFFYQSVRIPSVELARLHIVIAILSTTKTAGQQQRMRVIDYGPLPLLHIQQPGIATRRRSTHTCLMHRAFHFVYIPFRCPVL